MDAVVVLEWKFSPADYFGSSFEIKQNDYTITVADGKAEAKINSVAYEANSSIRSELNDVLESAFLGAQLSNNKIYNLLRPDLTRVEHADGRKDYFLEVEPAYIKITPHPVTLSKCDNDGNVIEDLETQRTKKYIDLIRKHCKDEVLKKLLKSRNASMNDSDNELTHLYEIYDAGMVNNVAFMIQAGYIKKPVYIQFVMGVLGGITPSPENLMFLVDYAKKQIGDFEFSVCVAGRAQFPICTQSLLIGGNARVGLEDNLYLEKGQMAKSNAEQVAKIVRIARELGIEPATPDEARQILGLKGLDHVNF